jgi:hypothetical protein
MPLLWRRNDTAGADWNTPNHRARMRGRNDLSAGTRRLLLALSAAVLAWSGARAATCPAFPPPVIKFTPIPSDVERDLSKTAKELGAAAKPMPAGYGRALSGAAAQSLALQKQADGTICAALSEVDFKLGFKRTIYVAQEFATDRCVADTVADLEMPVVKSDDDALAQFGASIPQAYAADIDAIGTNASQSRDDVQKPLTEKVSAVWKEKIFPAFVQQVGAAAAKVDLGTWHKASCNGATDKAFATINSRPSDFSAGSWRALLQAQMQPQSGSGNMGMGMGMGMGGMMGK